MDGAFSILRCVSGCTNIIHFGWDLQSSSSVIIRSILSEGFVMVTVPELTRCVDVFT